MCEMHVVLGPVISSRSAGLPMLRRVGYFLDRPGTIRCRLPHLDVVQVFQYRPQYLCIHYGFCLVKLRRIDRH